MGFGSTYQLLWCARCVQDNAICTNVVGSFTCECIDGYSGDPVKRCRAIRLIWEVGEAPTESPPAPSEGQDRSTVRFPDLDARPPPGMQWFPNQCAAIQFFALTLIAFPGRLCTWRCSVRSEPPLSWCASWATVTFSGSPILLRQWCTPHSHLDSEQCFVPSGREENILGRFHA